MQTIKFFSVQECRDNPNSIYVFGDNLIGKGKGGQAVIRDEPNAFGIPTKCLPSRSMNAYFSDKDSERTDVFRAIDKLEKLMIYDNYKIIFPADGIGTGLAMMEKKSPCLFREMNEVLRDTFK